MLVNTKNFMYEFAEEVAGGQDQNSSDGMKNTDTKDGQDKNTAEHMIPKSSSTTAWQYFIRGPLQDYATLRNQHDEVKWGVLDLPVTPYCN